MAACVSEYKAPLLTIEHPIHGRLFAYQPMQEEVEKTAAIAKQIFIKAFSDTYTEFHKNSASAESIEKWLNLREEVGFTQWLSATFDEEYDECLAGKKFFVYLKNSEDSLIGWLSHGPVSETGEMYLSQCSLEAAFRCQKVATGIFAKVFKDEQIKTMFPGVKEIKLITRKMNTIACHLYEKAGFIRDETIDPQVYGGSYNDRYVGYRWTLLN